jgi:hypothetical protein
LTGRMSIVTVFHFWLADSARIYQYIGGFIKF